MSACAPMLCTSSGSCIFSPEVNQVQAQTYDNHDAQHQHVLRGPFHGFRLVNYGVTLATARCAVLHRQPESVDDVDHERGGPAHA